MYFGNTYCTDGMYKISTTVSTSVVNEIFTSEYSSTLWHNRLCHIVEEYSEVEISLITEVGIMVLILYMPSVW